MGQQGQCFFCDIIASTLSFLVMEEMYELQVYLCEYFNPFIHQMRKKHLVPAHSIIRDKQLDICLVPLFPLTHLPTALSPESGPAPQPYGPLASSDYLSPPPPPAQPMPTTILASSCLALSCWSRWVETRQMDRDLCGPLDITDPRT